jgi:hypothetical protein
LSAHVAVPLADVVWLEHLVNNEGISFHDALLRLRKKLFPDNYEPSHWVEGNSIFNYWYNNV